MPIALALLAPLAAMLIAAKPVGGAGAVRLLIGTLTYPLMLFIDLYAALLGITDLLVGQPVWTKIKRENVVATDAVPETLRDTMTTANVRTGRFARLLWIPAAALFVVLANDLLSPSDCGQVHPFLWRPLLVHRQAAVDLDLVVKTARIDADRLEVSFDAVVTNGAVLGASYFLDGAKVTERSAILPLGWAQHEVKAELRGDEFICHRTRRFSTAFKEINGREFLINGEPFLVKGMIPSFSTNQIGLDFPTGLAQIKAAGANAIRVYHEPRAEVLDAAAKEQLLVLAQPDRSTWENVDLDSESDRKKLVRRYRALIDDTEGYPYLLMDTLGNELELTGKLDTAVANVTRLLDAARPERRFPLSYSTYYTFIDYPVDVVGVNMLDTGTTYWNKALGFVARFGKPFFATELGGFVAFHERLPWELRSARIREEWAHLQRAGAIGAFFFESHDNWAQSVPPGEVNDPLRPEQPDDARGFWDEKNRPKPELTAVERLFRDVTARTAPEVLAADATTVQTTFTNVRPYALRGVHARLADGHSLEIGDLAPREERTLEVPLSALSLTLQYTTHHGLAATCPITIHAPRLGPEPIVLNDDFTQGKLADSRTLHVLVPSDWPSIKINGTSYDRPADGKLDVPMRGPFYEVVDYAATNRGADWQLRFKLPVVPHPENALLLLRGVGADHARITVNGQARDQATHNYRDNLIALADLHASAGDEVVVTMTRDQVEYVNERFSPDHGPIRIDVDPPQVFSAMAVDIAR